MFFLQSAIHFDDFAKAAGMHYIGRNRNNARRASCFMARIACQAFFTQIFTPSNKKKRAFYEPAWYYVT